jgi:hypothetical protein
MRGQLKYQLLQLNELSLYVTLCFAKSAGMTSCGFIATHCQL